MATPQCHALDPSLTFSNIFLSTEALRPSEDKTGLATEVGNVGNNLSEFNDGT